MSLLRLKIKGICNLFYVIITSTLLLSCQKDMMDVPDSKGYTISSAYTKNKYNIQVLYPDKYDSSVDYPTIYLLDGDWYFYNISEFVKSNYPTEVILIGIGYKNDNKRITDYTYPKDNGYSGASGGGKKYLNFLNNELIPYIENDLSIKSSERTIAGHSLGGYFVIYQLFQKDFETKFDNVIAISPSLFWKDSYIFDLEKEYQSSHDFLNKRLFITVGDLEGVTMNTHFDAFTTLIKDRQYNNLTLEYYRVKNTSHNGNAIKSIENGISFILN